MIGLLGQISDIFYYTSFSENLPDGYNSPIFNAKYNSINWLDKHFLIVMCNGVVENLVVDKNIPNWELNLLKGIVSQLQIDTTGENLMNTTITQLPENGRNSGVYKTMEDTVSGIYETLYEINPLPEYKIQLEPNLVPSE